MRSYYDFRIFYKGQEINNIFEITEEVSYVYGEREQVDSLIIKYINNQGKLVIEKFDVRDLTFQSKRGEINEFVGKKSE